MSRSVFIRIKEELLENHFSIRIRGKYNIQLQALYSMVMYNLKLRSVPTFLSRDRQMSRTTLNAVSRSNKYLKIGLLLFSYLV